MIRQAVLLVGGLGTRLGAKTRDTPKPLLPIAGRSFLEWLVDELRRYGLTDIVLLAGFHGEQVQQVLGGAQDVDVLIEPAPLGTGGALAFAADRLDDRFFCLNGDSLFDINLWDLATSAPEAEAILAVRPVAEVSRFGAVALRGDHIVGFAERSAVSGPGLINAGVGVFSKTILGGIAPGRPTSLEGEIYPALAAERRLFGRVYDAPFIDIGVPEDLARAQTFVPEHLRRGAVVFERDRLLAAGPHAGVGTGLSWRRGAAAAIKAVNDAGLYAFVIDSDITFGTASGDVGPSAILAALNAVLSASGAHIDGFATSRAAVQSPAGEPGATLVLPSALDELLARFSADRARVAVVEHRPGPYSEEGDDLIQTAVILAAALGR